MSGDRLHWLFPPFVAAGLPIHLLRPAPLFPHAWMGPLIGLPVVAAGVAIALVGGDRWSRPAGSLVASAGAGLALGSLWPLVLLLPALILAIRWRALRVQTGHRRHEG